MKRRKPRVFVASAFIGLEEERQGLLKLFEEYENRIESSGCEHWRGGAAADLESCMRARNSDYLILILGGRYGTISPRTGLSITELEYREFLYTHVRGCSKLGDLRALYVFEKDKGALNPDHVDVSCDNLNELSKFKAHVSKRFSVREKFRNWHELQDKVKKILETFPPSVPDTGYEKVSLDKFAFKLLGVGRYREKQMKTIWSNCPCVSGEKNVCEREEDLQFRPPKYLRIEMERHLEELFSDPKSLPQWKKSQPSFKTISIQEDGSHLCFRFCRSTWHQFLGTNQGATKDRSIRNILDRTTANSLRLEDSPFSNNLGITIAVIDSESEMLYTAFRTNVSVHPDMRAASIGTQLHAYDSKHLETDGRPNIFGAAYQELNNEANITEDDIRDLYVAGWGIGLRTGTPELLFVCDSRKLLHTVFREVCDADIRHSDEFDTKKMTPNDCIMYDYEFLAAVAENPDAWEPESVVACGLAFNGMVEGCIAFGKEDDADAV